MYCDYCHGVCCLCGFSLGCLSSVVSPSVVNCLERLASKMTHYVSSETLNRSINL